MTHERALAILAAYGADPARWPADEREPLRAMLGASALREAYADAKALDAMLAHAPATGLPSDGLMAAVLAQGPKRGEARASMPLARVVAALAACAVIGLASGMGAAQLMPTTRDDAELQALVAGALAPGGDDWLEVGIDG